MLVSVTKASGITQPFQKEKIMKVIEWACECTHVLPSVLYDKALPQLRDGMTTRAIQQAITKTAADNITVETPDYQFVAARLSMFDLRKQVYGRFEPTDFYQHIKANIVKGVYDKEILEKYTRDEIELLEKHIDHNRDFKFSYAGAMQFKEKYLVKDRSTGQIFETPQYAYMLISMCLHQEEADDRIQHVIDFYDAASNLKISLPTPILAGVRTPTRQFSSCVKIEIGDSLKSINNGAAAIVSYISKRAGIGLNAGAIRAEGSRIRSGEIRHTGVIPFWKHFQTAVKSCSQGGVRGGAATMHYPIWHLEFENLIVLKNNKGVEENRIRQMDYSVQINNLMYDRLIDNKYITLFSPDVMEGRLLDAFYSNPDEFKRLYEMLECDPDVRKKQIKAVDLFTVLMNERANTGRIYINNIDNANEYGCFVRDIAPIKMSNLCQEIALPTSDIGGVDPEIALCTLAAFVLGNFDDAEIPQLSRVMVRALDNLLDYQDYPHPAAYKAKKRRALGIGVTNYAAYLADNFYTYDDANKLTHSLFESIQYHLLDASADLAKERGNCDYFHETKYAHGYLPIDWYNKNVDRLVENQLNCDWESLRSKIAEYGLRNSTLTALMPCESSSQISNSTNGIEPPRGPVSVKQSKDGVFNQVVPNVEQNKDLYTYTWNMVKTGMTGYLTQVCIMQKFVDQAISANTYYDPSTYTNGKTPLSVLLKDILFYNMHGGKNLYYHNTRDGADGTEDSSGCESCKL